MTVPMIALAVFLVVALPYALSRVSRVSTAVTEAADVQEMESTTHHATSPVNVRAGPGTEYGVRNTLSSGQEVSLGRADENGWAPILDPGGQTIGHVLARLLERGPAPGGTQPKPVPARSGWITGCEDGELALETVNLWSTPNKGRVVGSLSGTSRSDRCRGAPVRIIGEATDRVGNRQFRVQSPTNGANGWVTYWFVVLESGS